MRCACEGVRGADLQPREEVREVREDAPVRREPQRAQEAQRAQREQQPPVGAVVLRADQVGPVDGRRRHDVERHPAAHVPSEDARAPRLEVAQVVVVGRRHRHEDVGPVEHVHEQQPRVARPRHHLVGVEGQPEGQVEAHAEQRGRADLWHTHTHAHTRCSGSTGARSTGCAPGFGHRACVWLRRRRGPTRAERATTAAARPSRSRRSRPRWSAPRGRPRTGRRRARASPAPARGCRRRPPIRSRARFRRSRRRCRRRRRRRRRRSARAWRGGWSGGCLARWWPARPRGAC